MVLSFSIRTGSAGVPSAHLAPMLQGNRFGPNRCLKYLIACVVWNSDMPTIERGRIDSDLGRNKLCLCNRSVVITAIQPQRVLVSAPIPYVKIVMWHGNLGETKARQGAGPLSQLLLLLALGIGLITLLVCTLGVLLSSP